MTTNNSKVDYALPYSAVRSFPRDIARWLVDQIQLLQMLDNKVLRGTGSPQGVITADPGTLYLNQSGGTSTTLYVYEGTVTGNNHWVAK